VGEMGSNTSGSSSKAFVVFDFVCLHRACVSDCMHNCRCVSQNRHLSWMRVLLSVFCVERDREKQSEQQGQQHFFKEESVMCVCVCLLVSVCVCE